ncbi:substrate-binding periplasmic protein [Undibacterium terreum]|uniref:ABC transporter n=1 Tax=Undibacterium terreum TaxID=1224302 RepID=A0A916V0J3_9BURK|nr:transporter substrate-binding domain-containing protein [Undibacterium terreum]GGC94611.1 ABC transporter [Undibacterium terreum]
MSKYLSILLAGVVALSLQWAGYSHAQDKTMRLASLEWGPYVSSHMPDGGLTASAAKAIASVAGYQLQIEHLPWSRAMQAGSDDPGYAGYFPAFYLPEREKQCYFSSPLGSSTNGFAHLKKTAFHWKELSDLKDIKIGTVQDYANDSYFDALVRQGDLHTDVAPTDISNIRKLLAGRVQAIVIDKAVLRSLLINEPSLQQEKEQILFDEHELTNFSLHICFQRNAKGKAMQQAFNTAVAKVKLKQMENDYYQSLAAAPRHQRLK